MILSWILVLMNNQLCMTRQGETQAKRMVSRCRFGKGSECVALSGVCGGGDGDDEGSIAYLSWATMR